MQPFSTIILFSFSQALRKSVLVLSSKKPQWTLPSASQTDL